LTFPHIGNLEASDDNDNGDICTITLRYRCAWLGAYSFSSILFADAQLDAALADDGVERSCDTPSAGAVTAAKAALRAIDLALLRGGPQWNTLARKTIERASQITARQYAAGNSKDEAEASSSKSSDTNLLRRKRKSLCSSSPEFAHPPRAELEMSTKLWISGESTSNVTRISRVASASLDLARFRDKFMMTATPIVITGEMSEWPACVAGSGRAWNDIGYLRRLAGERLVPVEMCDSIDRSQGYLSSSWSQEVMRLSDFIDTCVKTTAVGEHPSHDARKQQKCESCAVAPTAADHAEVPRRTGYLAQHQLFDQIPSLRSDIEIPRLCKSLLPTDVAASAENATRVNAWFGPAGTVSPLHYDPFHNLLCQVVGYKYIRLVDAQYSSRLYRRKAPRHNNSHVDLETVEPGEFPKFDGVPMRHCILGPGEMLYIPRHCWHYVRSLSTSFSASFWWGGEQDM